MTQPEKAQRPLRCRPVRGRRRLVEPNARMPSGLHDLRDGELLRVIGLQMWCDQANPRLEDLQRHTRLDPGPLHAAADRHAMVAVQSAQQCGLARPVRAVHDPALALMNFKRYALERHMLIQIDGGVDEPHERLARPRGGASPLRLWRSVVIGMQPALQSRSRSAAALAHRAHRAPVAHLAHFAAISDPARFEHQHVRHTFRHILEPMGRENPRQPGPACVLQPTQCACAIGVIEAVQQFVQ